MNSQVYLKQNVQIEPLYNQWYAWSYLISPATAPLYVANSHLKIMESFLTAPQAHVAALKNPAMMGGPFINYGPNRTREIRELLDRTTKEQSHMLEFADAVRSLNKMLLAEAQGFSLEPLYSKVPEPLRGYVELVYDLNNQVSVRMMEGLLYKSRYYDPGLQSINLSLAEKDGRPFVFSTPSLRENDRLNFRLPFKDERLDQLYRMKESPRPYEHIRELLEVKPEDEPLFASFFTETPAPCAPRYQGTNTRIRYFGHACVLIETSNVSILCDPVISYKYGGYNDRYTFADLPQTIDYAMITHGHQDHCMFETLLQLKHKIKRVVVPRSNNSSLADPSLKMVLHHLGFKNVVEIDEMEEVEFEGGKIVGLPFLGEHGDLNITTKIAYFIRTEDKSILCAADSNNIETRLYDRLYEAIGTVDVLFIGMECDGGPLTWLYGSLLNNPISRKMDQSRRFDGSDFRKAVDIIERLNPTQVYVYAMGQEPWLTYLTSIVYTDTSRPIVESDKLVEECRRRGITAERLYGYKEIF
jgi:L-ascorbate metabolism protein UlaG (beta-lactamase superfamily)